MVLAPTPGPVPGREGEAILDAEWASAAAPNASIMLASCADSGIFGGFIAFENLLTNGGALPAVVSLSYGEPEASLGTTGNMYINSLYSLAASEGVSVFVSAGDSGSGRRRRRRRCPARREWDPSQWVRNHTLQRIGWRHGFRRRRLQPKSPPGPGIPTSTYWSSTNGTYFASALGYIPEIPWNSSCASALLAQYNTNAASTVTYGLTGFCSDYLLGGLSYLTTDAGGGGASGNLPEAGVPKRLCRQSG